MTSVMADTAEICRFNLAGWIILGTLSRVAERVHPIDHPVYGGLCLFKSFSVPNGP
jgi:hypothetical protein